MRPNAPRVQPLGQARCFSRSRSPWPQQLGRPSSTTAIHFRHRASERSSACARSTARPAGEPAGALSAELDLRYACPRVAYRNDLDAARARIDALERELAELIEANSALVESQRELERRVRGLSTIGASEQATDGKRREPGIAWLVAVVIAYVGATASVTAWITRDSGAVVMSALAGLVSGVFFMFGLHMVVFPTEPAMRRHGVIVMAAAVAVSGFSAWVGWGWGS